MEILLNKLPIRAEGNKSCPATQKWVVYVSILMSKGSEDDYFDNIDRDQTPAFFHKLVSTYLQIAGRE